MMLEGTFSNGVIVPNSPENFAEGTLVTFEQKQAPSHINEPGAGEPTLRGLLALAGIANDLPADMAAEHDHSIHGTPRRKPVEPS